MQSKTIINLLSNEVSRHFIETHILSPSEKVALLADKHPETDVRTASTLISLYQKASIKLPEHYTKRAALNQKAYEQCTSERVAAFKAEFMNVRGKTVLNLCGGLGVDDLFFARSGAQVISCEKDPSIHELAQYNLGLFRERSVERKLTDGITYLETAPDMDILYLDPDRRPHAGKVFRLEDCEPNVMKYLSLFLSKAREVWLKLSPMADIHYLERSLGCVNRVAVISWQEEVKEILISCSSAADKPAVERYAVRLTRQETQMFKHTGEITAPVYSAQGKYLLEPDKSIIKSNLSASYAASLKRNMMGPNTHFYLSEDIPESFQGRVFEIKTQMPYKPKLIKAYLKEHGIRKADITIRNLRETTEQLRRRFQLSQSGTNYLCFATDAAGNAWMFDVKPV